MSRFLTIWRSIPDKVWAQFASKPAGFVETTIGSITKITINLAIICTSPTGLKTNLGNPSPTWARNPKPDEAQSPKILSPLQLKLQMIFNQADLISRRTVAWQPTRVASLSRLKIFFSCFWKLCATKPWTRFLSLWLKALSFFTYRGFRPNTGLKIQIKN